MEGVDLDNKRARTTSKGGDTEWLHFQSGSADTILAARPAEVPDGPTVLPAEFEALRWFRLPTQCLQPADTAGTPGSRIGVQRP